MTNKDIAAKHDSAIVRLDHLKVALERLAAQVAAAQIAVASKNPELITRACDELNPWLDKGMDGMIDKAVLALNAYEEAAGNPNLCLI